MLHTPPHLIVPLLVFLFRKFDNTFIEASARRLKEMNIFGRSDPFLVVSTKIDGELVEVFQTEIVPNTTKPQWPLVKIRSNRLYDSSCKFVVKVYSRNRLRKNSLIGAAKVENIFLVNENETKTTKIVIKDRNKDNENSGIVIFTVTRRSYERSKHIVIPYHLVSNTPLTQDQK